MIDIPAASPTAFIAALKADDPARAAAIAAGLLSARVPLGAQWQGVARFAAAEAEWSIAVEAMRRFVLDDPQAVDRRLALAEIMSQAGRVDEVVAILTPIAAQLPADPRIRHALAVALIQTGDRDAGLDHLRAALRVRPGSGPSWLALANAHRFTHGDRDFARLAEAQAGFARAPAADRASAHYAFGKALDDLGDHDRAFAAIAEGARITAIERPYAADDDRSAALATIADRPDAAPPAAGPADGAIFVTGKPRSGTTLVEQILASHSAIAGGGEINILGPAVRAVAGAGARFSPIVAPHALAAFRDRYAHLAAARFGGSGRIVDKSLNTSRFAGSIRRAMPDVPLVWLRRDPLDTAWSSFRTYFAQGVGWSFDLVAMGLQHAIEDALHAHWADRYGARLMTVDYAELVDRPGPTIAALLAHCGLAEEPQVHDFHQTRRAVQTASVDQVRRPINRAGLDSAAPYRAHLAPYERAYAAARRELGLS